MYNLCLYTDSISLVLVLANGDLAFNLRAHLDKSNILRLDGVIGLFAKVGSLAVAVLGHRLAVGEALVAGAARQNSVAQVALVGGVLVENLVPVSSEAAEATRNDLVKDANLARLGKVLEPVGAAVAGRGVGVLGIVALPLIATREG